MLAKLKRFRKYFLSSLRKRNFKNIKVNNPNVSLLTNNCVGGCIYHDLGLKFLSPTINLFIPVDDFINFVCNFEQYTLNGLLIESTASSECPVGILMCDNLPNVEVQFIHYKTFDEAKNKWDERIQRVDLDNSYCIISSADKINDEIIEKAKKIKIPYKILSSLPSNDENHVLHMPFFDKFKNNKPITSFWGGWKKGYDSFDFVDEIFEGKKKKGE